jgi:hypothetical protein
VTTTTDHQPLTDEQIAEIEARDYRRDQNGAAAYRQSDLAAQDVPALLVTVDLLRRELDLLRAELPRMCARVREQAAQELQDTVKGIVERAVRKGYDIGGPELDELATALGIPTT